MTMTMTMDNDNSAGEVSVHVEYYAILREQSGCSSERVTTCKLKPSELYEELQKKHGFTLPFSQLRTAINEEFTDGEPDSLNLCDGDRVVFLPPVAGG